MAAGPNGLEEWVGSAYLFVESSLDKVVLSESYAHQQHKAAVYRALRTALAESGGSPEELQMLKIRSDPQLIVQLRFCGRQACSRFHRAYREGTAHRSAGVLGGCSGPEFRAFATGAARQRRAAGRLADRRGTLFEFHLRPEA